MYLSSKNRIVNCNEKANFLGYFFGRQKSDFLTSTVINLINLNIYIILMNLYLSYFLMKQHEKELNFACNLKKNIVNA